MTLMNITTNVFFLLEKRIQIVLFSVMIILLFVPYLSILSFVLAIFLAASVYIERYTKRLTSQMDVTWRQFDSILFKDDRCKFTLDLTNVHLLNEMSTKTYIRTPKDKHYTVNLEGHTESIIELDELSSDFVFELTGNRRGPIEIAEISLTISLPLSLGTLTLYFSPPLRWTVYPSISSTHAQRIRSHLKLGERVSKYSPIKDRLLQISSKPYEDEPSRQIDWYATAKKSTLQTKLYQPVNQDMFTVYLDLSASNGIGLHHQFEELIEDTALVSRELIESGGKVELFVNRLDQKGHVNHLSIQEGAKQLKNILALLSSLSEQDHYMGSTRFSPYVTKIKNKQAQLIKIASS